MSSIPAILLLMWVSFTAFVSCVLWFVYVPARGEPQLFDNPYRAYLWKIMGVWSLLLLASLLALTYAPYRALGWVMFLIGQPREALCLARQADRLQRKGAAIQVAARNIQLRP